MRAQKLDSHTYKVNLDDNYCVGAVPNGGYAASCMLAAANAHLASRDQSDTLTAHFEYPARASPGPAIVIVEDVKLGRSQLSTLHLTLWQGGLQSQKPWITPSLSKRIVLAYTTHADLRTFNGLSMPTGYEASPAAAMPEPLPDFQVLQANTADNAWQESELPPNSGPLHSLRNWRFYLPRAEPPTAGVLDMWIRAASGERIKQNALPYVVDSFPFNMHAYLAAPELRELFFGPPPRAKTKPTGGTDRDEEGQVSARASLWLPTVVMNLEVKTVLPEEGVEWLAVRVTSKQIKDGRFDLEVLVRNVDGEIVALSQHVALILSLERNMAKQNPSSKPSL
ncbi:putative thioesterase family protein [Rosellinia necatrix]|uniref:Putative thioesterase family protein n=1 Tax=Rosellinia necatrix TaxID=77044 RepID=A0A1S7UPN4_ROSNE|nr:putative thioesterase family protein [Rosellinia necatrix]